MKGLLGVFFHLVAGLFRLPLLALRGLRGAGPLPVLSLSALAAVVAIGWLGFSGLKDTPAPAIDTQSVTASIPKRAEPAVPAADYAAGDAALRALLE